MKQLFLFLLLSLTSVCWATHDRAGEITYEQIGAHTIRMKITTYTKTSGTSIQADRAMLDVDWGDGIIETVLRDNYLDTLFDIRRNEYIATHTYPGFNLPGQPYIISMQDPNRNENILNINGGNSVNLEFYVQTEVFLFASSLNSSPICTVPPIEGAVVGQIFQHTPNANDPDGDSIAYELISPMSDRGVVVFGYVLPSAIMAGTNNQLTMDSTTGVMTWNAPQAVGEYNVAYLVKSYRNGVYMGAVVRDMQINVVNLAVDTLPEITTISPDLIELHTAQIGTIQQDFVVHKHSATSLGFDFYATSFISNLTTDTLFQNADSVKLRYEWTPNFDTLSPYAQHAYIAFRTGYNYTLFSATPVKMSVYKVIKVVYRGLHLSNNSIANENNLLRLYPNPTSHELNIQLPEYPEKTNLSIIATDGKIVQQMAIPALTTNYVFSTTALPQGVYVVQLQNAKHRITQTFVKRSY